MFGSHFSRSHRCFFGSKKAEITWRGEDSFICILPAAEKAGSVPVVITDSGQGSMNLDRNHDTATQQFIYEESSGEPCVVASRSHHLIDLLDLRYSPTFSEPIASGQLDGDDGTGLSLSTFQEDPYGEL